MILLGLDGATWDVLDPLLADGHLPNLANLQSGGQRAPLESIYPPTSAPAWTSMGTGMNPGKTGVYYFLNRTDPDSFEFRSASSADFEGKSFWDLLNDHGYSVGVYNFPVLGPPYDIDGYMVSGFGTGDTGRFATPEALEDELHSLVGGQYEITVPFSDPKYADRPEALAERLHDHLDDRERVIEHLLTERPTDVFCGVISATDWMQHYFWKYADESHVEYDPDADRERELYRGLWDRVDEIVGTVAEIAADRGETLVILSDHGFGPFQGTFYVNDWLREEGFYESDDDSVVGRLTDRVFPYLRAVAEPVVRRVPILNDVATAVGGSIQPSATDRVDPEASVACATNKGFVHMLPGSEHRRKAVAERLAERFEAEGLEYEISAPEDHYTGPNVDLAPDVLFTIEDFEYALQADRATDDDVFVEGPPDPSRSGGHKRDGILLVSGGESDGTLRDHPSLLDLAPTILHAHDVPVPESMDGDVLGGLADTETVETRAYGLLDEERESSGDTEAMREHLEDLGYV